MNEEFWKRASGLIYAGSESDQRTRFTQDFPILPDVWRALIANGFQRVDVLLTPDSRRGAAGLLRAVENRCHLGEETIHRNWQVRPRGQGRRLLSALPF